MDLVSVQPTEGILSCKGAPWCKSIRYLNLSHYLPLTTTKVYATRFYATKVNNGIAAAFGKLVCRVPEKHFPFGLLLFV